MPAPILVTKLYAPPPRAKIVQRARLIEPLNAGLAADGKLTLVSAPAGFGKTTLLSEWLAGCGLPAAWLSLDEGDNDLPRFLTYLIAAVRTIMADFGEGVLAGLQSPQPPASELILTDLLNEIASVSGRFILVLDDYHAIDAGAIDAALAFLLEHLPPQMHLVIASREDPSLPLARLRARGRLTELRAADLRFTSIEAAEFLNRVMGLDLPAEDIAALETRTEGWIAGLQLAALSMQGRTDIAGFIQAFTGSNRFVLDYLVEEVLRRQPEHLRTFLIQTAILDRFCAPLCNSVTQREDGKEILDILERGNMFLIPLDDTRRWYRYHHLFAEVLQAHLWEGQFERVSMLNRRASEWFEQNHLLAEAFRHALAASDFERAAQLAEAAWQSMERNFQTAAWLGWVKKLPDAVICSRPKLCFQLGSAFSDAGEPEISETHLQNAERALAGATDQAEAISLPGNIALIRANNAQIQGNLADTMKYAELSLQLIPEDDVYVRAQAVITLELIHWTTGDLEASLRAMYAWREDMLRLGNRVFAIASAFAVADMQVILGKLGEAEKTLWQAIQLADVEGQEAKAITAHHHLALALLAHERGDEAAATKHLQTAADLGQHTTLVDWSHRWNLAQARLRESAGEWDAALDLLDKARQAYIKNAVPILRPVEALKTRIYLKQGRLDKAAAWALERRLAVTDEVDYLGEYEYLTLARVRLSEGVDAGVGELLERLLALAEAQKRTGSVIEILLTQVLLYKAQGNSLQAFAALERALALTGSEGYLRIFLDEGEAMRSLLEDFRSANEKQAEFSLRGYVDKILEAFSQPAEIDSRPTTIKQTSEIIESLTDRELEILRLIADGRSNAEISRRLFLALSTVKGHNLRIFSKLQVQNRTEAVARARKLGCI